MLSALCSDQLLWLSGAIWAVHAMILIVAIWTPCLAKEGRWKQLWAPAAGAQVGLFLGRPLSWQQLLWVLVIVAIFWLVPGVVFLLSEEQKRRREEAPDGFWDS